MYSRKMSVDNFLLLQACRQNKTESLGLFIEETWGKVGLAELESMGLVEYIKGKKNQSMFSKVRTTKKGNEILDDIETPEITEDDLKFFDWLEESYKGSGRVIGNRKKTKMYIALFRAHSNIDKNRLAVLINSFLNNESEMGYSKKLEYLFFKPSSVFQTKFDIEQSRLYQYYLKHQEQFDKVFEKYD